MAAADCEICKAAGYRACDLCGDVAFVPGTLLDLCPSCREATVRTGGQGGGSRQAAPALASRPPRPWTD